MKYGELIEAAAEKIFDAMPYDGTAGPTKPAWVPGGNSIKQGEARRYAALTVGEVRNHLDSSGEYPMEPLDYFREFWVWKLRITLTRDRNAGTGIEFMWNPYDAWKDIRDSGGLREP